MPSRFRNTICIILLLGAVEFRGCL